MFEYYVALAMIVLGSVLTVYGYKAGLKFGGVVNFRTCFGVLAFFCGTLLLAYKWGQSRAYGLPAGAETLRNGESVDVRFSEISQRDSLMYYLHIIVRGERRLLLIPLDSTLCSGVYTVKKPSTSTATFIPDLGRETSCGTIP
jgi:hypothetical protein